MRLLAIALFLAATATAQPTYQRVNDGQIAVTVPPGTFVYGEALRVTVCGEKDPLTSACDSRLVKWSPLTKQPIVLIFGLPEGKITVTAQALAPVETQVGREK